MIFFIIYNSLKIIDNKKIINNNNFQIIIKIIANKIQFKII